MKPSYYKNSHEENYESELIEQAAIDVITSMRLRKKIK